MLSMTQGDDKGRQLGLGHQQAIGQAKQGGGTDAEQDGDRGRQTKVGGHLGHDDAAQRHDHAAGQIDAGGQDDEGLADRDRAHHHHLLQDQGEILQRQKTIALH
jgi:hypothetical protein